MLSNAGSFKSQITFDGDDDGNSTDNIVDSTNVKVNKTLLFEKLSPNQEYPEKLAYYLYGSESEYHISHLIS
jgi:hypothetical protein